MEATDLRLLIKLLKTEKFTSIIQDWKRFSIFVRVCLNTSLRKASTKKRKRVEQTDGEEDEES